MISQPYSTLVARKSFSQQEVDTLGLDIGMWGAVDYSCEFLSRCGYKRLNAVPNKAIMDYRLEFVFEYFNDVEIEWYNNAKIVLFSTTENIDEDGKIKQLTHYWKFGNKHAEPYVPMKRVRDVCEHYGFDIEIKHP
jgi:hypothetical protein